MNSNKAITSYVDYLVELEQSKLDQGKPGEEFSNYGQMEEFLTLSDCLETSVHRGIQEEIGCNLSWNPGCLKTNGCVGIINKFYSAFTFSLQKRFIWDLMCGPHC